MFWNEFPQGIIRADRITYLHGSQLLRFLQDQAPTLSQPGVELLADALRRLKLERDAVAAAVAP